MTVRAETEGESLRDRSQYDIPSEGRRLPYLDDENKTRFLFQESTYVLCDDLNLSEVRRALRVLNTDQVMVGELAHDSSFRKTVKDGDVYTGPEINDQGFRIAFAPTYASNNSFARVLWFQDAPPTRTDRIKSAVKEIFK